MLVWCNPIEGGRRRDRLDALREAADAGVWISTHPDTIQRLGTKDVLVETRELPFGSHVQRVDSLARLVAELPARLESGPRVLKQHRGHSGIGVWRVERADDGALLVRHAQRGCAQERIDLAALCERLAPNFEPEAGGHMIDRAWQPRIAKGTVRAYLVEHRVAGFGVQAVNALHPGETAPGQRLCHGPDRPDCQVLKQRLESSWVRRLCRRVGVPRERLPLLWDCDFMFGERAAGQPERCVLCEVNVSSVSPFPHSAIGPLVAAAQTRLATSRVD